MTKRQGLHPDKELTAVKVRQTTKPGRYSDGNGLYLVVSNTGAKRWLLRTIVQGRRRDMGLGSVNLVGLAEAREKAVLYRKLAREGEDPIDIRKQQQTSVPTFAEAAHKVFEQSKSTWKNEKHAQQWITTLETYAVPTIGNMRVDHVKSADILRVLSPIWLVKAETARRIRQRLKMVFDWARTAGFTTGENPVVGIERGLPKHTAKPKHHAAMLFADVRAACSIWCELDDRTVGLC
ncbi:MAG: Arm DNA-binding domain-containing protein [Roseobacter sp.]